MILDNLLKYWKEEAMVLLVILGFAAGRYTMRSSVEQQLDATYKAQYSELLTKVETDYKLKLQQQSDDFEKQLKQSKSKSTVTDKTVITKPDGTKIVQEHTADKETDKTSQNTKDQKTTKEVSSDSKTSQQQSQKQTQTEQTVKETKTVTPPPSWRVYGIAALTAPTSLRESQYGAGAMEDLGPVSVGALGLYCPQTRDATLGFTLGISF